ncbi:hypothetical protein AAG906_002916 [Vitis piasezkii]
MATPSQSQPSGRGRKMILNGGKPLKKAIGEKQLKVLLRETETKRRNAYYAFEASTSGPPRRRRSRGQWQTRG